MLWTALTLLTVLAAVLVGIGKLLMPYSTRYQPQLEQWLSREFGQPVAIQSFTGEWKAFGPRITLQGLRLQEGDAGEIAVQRAALDIKPINFLLPGQPLYTFQILGADLSLQHAEDGRWTLSGLGVSGRGGAPGEGAAGVDLLASVGELRLENSALSFEDATRGIRTRLTGLRGRLRMQGDRIAAEIEANVSDPVNGSLIGDVEGTVVLLLGPEQRLASADWHAKTRELQISAVVEHMPEHPLLPRSGWLNAELWGGWEQGSAQSMEGALDVRDIRLGEGPQALQVDHLNARFHWSFLQRKVWRLDLADLEIEEGGRSWDSQRLSLERNIPGNLGLWVSADFLEVRFPLDLTQRIMANYRTAWPRNAPRQATGKLHEFDLVLDARWQLELSRGRFDGLRVWDWDRWPDVSGLRGQVDLEGGEGQVAFEGQGVTVDWPRNFTQAAVVDIPACRVDIAWGGQWRVDARDCVVRNELVDATARLRFAQNEGRPAVDVNAVIRRADLAAMDPYWPRSLVKPGVSGWLNKSVLGGAAASGRFSLRGDMDDWPFAGQQGWLDADLEIREVELDYFPGWPRALGLAGAVRFQGASMLIEATAEALGGVAVERVGGRIGDLRNAVLQLDYQTRADLSALVGFLRQTPLLEKSELDPDQFLLEGAAALTGALTIPLKQTGDPIAVNGRLELAANRFTERVSGFRLESIGGRVEFDRSGIRAAGLPSRYRGQDALLSLRADWTGGPLFGAELSGAFPVQELLPQQVRSAEPLLAALQGASDWAARLEVGDRGADGRRETWLEVRSALKGVSVDLPPPLAKSGDSEWPVVLRYPIHATDPVCTVNLPGRLAMAFDIPNGFEGVRRAALALGSAPATLPPEGFLRVAGRATQLDLDAWIRRLSERYAGQGMGRLALESATLHADEVMLLRRNYQSVDMGLTVEDGVINGNFDSEALAGGIRYRTSEDGSHTLTAQLDRLLIPDPPEGQESSMQTDPSQLPEMHIFASRFRYLGLDFGETRIEGYPRTDGFHFTSVEANSPDFTLNARGDWQQEETGERSDFNIVMTSESLGSLMSALDISTVLEGGQTMVRYDASWPGPPADFALANLNGEISFSIIQGTIVNADAGAGRVVGLMSVAALPRRLALDFRDVFGSGYSFDQAEGTVHLENGIAHTDDMVLKSTAATLEIVGSSDLNAQTFDYIMSVRPGVGQTLPVLGAIAGGPGGAAAGLALQGLLQQSLGDAAEARYSITGTWTEPLVVRIPMEPETERKNP